MRVPAVMAMLSAVLAAGCGSPRRASSDAGPMDAPLSDAVIVLPDGRVDRPDTGVAGEDGAITPGDGGGGTDVGGSAFAYCQRTCDGPADCASPSPLYDGTHYACEAGICRWLGCRTDDECRDAFGRTTYACVDLGGLAQCVMTCTTPADCASSPAFDADNYTCDAGLCEYVGCNTDDECAGSFASSAYVCREVMPPDVGLPVPTADRNCVLGCTTSTDCATSAAFDADNYACTDGACVYEGCRADTECTSTFGGPGWACR